MSRPPFEFTPLHSNLNPQAQNLNSSDTSHILPPPMTKSNSQTHVTQLHDSPKYAANTDDPAFPSDASPMSTPIHSPHPSRRPSLAAYQMTRPGGSLSRRSSMASGPRPITRAEYSGPTTPSLLSRAGSPTQPLANEQVRSRRSSFANEGGPIPNRLAAMGNFGGLGGLGGGFSQLDMGKRELRDGEFIGSVDCGTT